MQTFLSKSTRVFSLTRLFSACAVIIIMRCALDLQKRALEKRRDNFQSAPASAISETKSFVAPKKTRADLFCRLQTRSERCIRSHGSRHTKKSESFPSLFYSACSIHKQRACNNTHTRAPVILLQPTLWPFYHSGLKYFCARAIGRKGKRTRKGEAPKWRYRCARQSFLCASNPPQEKKFQSA